MNKLKTFDLSYFIGKSHFEEDGTQSYLVFQPLKKKFKAITNTNYISSWKSKGLSTESIKPPTTSDNSLTPALSYYRTTTRVEFTGSCLKQSKILYAHGKVVNIYIVHELGASSSHVNDPTIKNCLFGAVTLTKNADIDNMDILVIEWDLIEVEFFHFQVWICSKCINFRSRYEFFCNIDNKKKDILLLGIGPTQGLEHTLTAEKMYSINFTVTKKKFCLSLHYNGANSYLFVNGTKIYSEIYSRF